MPEILPGVHVVPLAQGLGAPGGVMNISLLVGDGRITAVDAGLPGSATAILDYLEEIGLAPQAIRRVIITHHHLDHVGGLPELLERSGAEVWAHRDDAPVIEGTVPRLPSRPSASRRCSPPFRPNNVIRSGAHEEDGRDRPRQRRSAPRWWRGAEHSRRRADPHGPAIRPDACAYLPALSLLIAGDPLRLEDGVIHESPTGFAADADQALASAKSVVALGFDGFIGYHGGYVVTGARELLGDSLTD